MKKFYDEPRLALLAFCAEDDVCEMSKFTDIDGELGDYGDDLVPDGDDL